MPFKEHSCMMYNLLCNYCHHFILKYMHLQLLIDVIFRSESLVSSKKDTNTHSSTHSLQIYLSQVPVHCIYSCTIISHFLIEGFGGKRALGFLLKSELCQKRSKFRMQFCLRVPNNVLHVFSPEVYIVFEILRMQKTLYLL